MKEFDTSKETLGSGRVRIAIKLTPDVIAVSTHPDSGIDAVVIRQSVNEVCPNRENCKAGVAITRHKGFKSAMQNTVRVTCISDTCGFN